MRAGQDRLSETETRELLQKAQLGSKSARERLVEANAGLVGSIVRRFLVCSQNRDADDLFQVGSIGLLKAIDRFDAKYDVCFSTYAVPLILGEIRRYLRDDALLSVSRTLKERAFRLERKRRELTMLWGAEPELWQLAEECGVSEEEAVAALDAIRPPLSFSEPRRPGYNSSASLADTLADSRAVFEGWLTDDLALRAAMATLPLRFTQVLAARYFEGKTQSEVASTLGVSQAQVSRVEKQALSLLRQKLGEEEMPDNSTCGNCV